MSRFSVAIKSQQHALHRVHPCDTCKVRAIAACGPLSADERQRLTVFMKTVTFAPRRLIFMETAPAASLYNVTDGVVKIYKMMPDGRRQVTGFLFPGDFLGLIQNETYAYSAEAVTETRLCQFPRVRLEALLKELPTLEQRLLGMASHELAAAQDQMVLLGRKSARERVASFLLMLSKATERQGLQADFIVVPMSRSDIADYLGLTTETVSRTLTQLSSESLIRLSNEKHVQLVDRAGLFRISAGL